MFDDIACGPALTDDLAGVVDRVRRAQATPEGPQILHRDTVREKHVVCGVAGQVTQSDRLANVVDAIRQC